MVRDAVYLKSDATETSDNAAKVLMKPRSDFSGYHRQAGFGSEDDVEEEICVGHVQFFRPKAGWLIIVACYTLTRVA